MLVFVPSSRYPVVAFALLLVVASAAGGCTRSVPAEPASPPPGAPAEGPRAVPSEPTVDEARAFIEEVNAELLKLWTDSARVSWVKSTYIIHDTEVLETQQHERVLEYTARKIKEARRFEKLDLPPELRRQFHLLRYSPTMPAPEDPAKRAELAAITTRLESMYGTGEYCSPSLKGKGRDKGSECLDLGDLSEILLESRDEKLLREVWLGWRKVSPPMRPLYERMVVLGNEGARELGFSDLSAIWQGRYDMDQARFAEELDRLWGQVKPLYERLHCFVRARLRKRYGADLIGTRAPIPAHLLGNMWAQDWSGIYPLVEPFPGQGMPDLTKQMKAKGFVPTVKGMKDPKAKGARGMVELAENFFTSIGMDPLPKTFWERSLFVQPSDREVVCHASAWDVDYSGDLRIKMCIRVNSEDLVVLHHELGHNYYFHYYDHLPLLFRDGANDGFHEGIGDTLALSVTPAYLAQVGLYDRVIDNERAEINTLMQRALDGVAFLPFGMLVDQWRWRVFAGAVSPSEYNAAWWRLRKDLQGVAPPEPRSEQAFDPGAKFHVAGNTPYARYFLARFLQYQFHRALCRAAGHQGPLHRCSIYGSKEAGAKLIAMMKLGQSRPWPDALELVSGERSMDASALVEYYAPLTAWLEKATAGEQCGWQ